MSAESPRFRFQNAQPQGPGGRRVGGRTPRLACLWNFYVGAFKSASFSYGRWGYLLVWGRSFGHHRL